jgi:hypothetical protein
VPHTGSSSRARRVAHTHSDSLGAFKLPSASVSQEMMLVSAVSRLRFMNSRCSSPSGPGAGGSQECAREGQSARLSDVQRRPSSSSRTKPCGAHPQTPALLGCHPARQQQQHTNHTGCSCTVSPLSRASDAHARAPASQSAAHRLRRDVPQLGVHDLIRGQFCCCCDGLVPRLGHVGRHLLVRRCAEEAWCVRRA